MSKHQHSNYSSRQDVYLCSGLISISQALYHWLLNFIFIFVNDEVSKEMEILIFCFPYHSKKEWKLSVFVDDWIALAAFLSCWICTFVFSSEYLHSKTQTCIASKTKRWLRMT